MTSAQSATIPNKGLLTFSQYALFGSDIALELGRLEPDLDRGRDVLDGFAQDDFGVLGCLFDQLRSHVGRRPCQLTFNSAAWNHTSSEFGHFSHPSAMILRA